MTLLLLLIARNLEGPSAAASSTKCSKSRVPYHKGPTNHNLEDYHMLRRYFEGIGSRRTTRRKIPRETTRKRGSPRSMTAS
jgi:hypothetical protein